MSERHCQRCKQAGPHIADTCPGLPAAGPPTRRRMPVGDDAPDNCLCECHDDYRTDEEGCCERCGGGPVPEDSDHA
jgi:hypothetical protein